MKGLFILLLTSFFITGCASGTPPACYNKAKIANHIYDVAVFKKENGKYLAGYPFHGWNDESAFVDTSECDRLNP